MTRNEIRIILSAARPRTDRYEDPPEVRIEAVKLAADLLLVRLQNDIFMEALKLQQEIADTIEVPERVTKQ